MLKIIFKKVVILAILVAVAVPFFVVATSHVESQEQTKEKEKKQLEEELAREEDKLREEQAKLAELKEQSAGYERDVAILENEIRQIQIRIRQNEIILQETGYSIQSNRRIIESLEERITKQKELLAELVLGIYKLDDTSSLEIILKSDSLSEFFNDINRIKSVQEGLTDTLDIVKRLKFGIEEEQIRLDNKVKTHTSVVRNQITYRNEVAQKTEEVDILLENSRTEEYEQWVVAKNTQKTVQEIRNQIFRLEAVGIAINFEEAYASAKEAGMLTGGRPALLMSVLKQESSWGANVGQCTLADPSTGMGRRMNGALLPRVMRADRVRNDAQAFLQLTEELGRNSDSTPVSCWAVSMGCTNDNVSRFSTPIIYEDGSFSCPSATPYPFGYGGAVGPAQFLPTTWFGYKDKVSSLLGRIADPWRILDSFVASGVKLADSGARSQAYSDELCAVRKYFSGNCTSGASVGYGNQVMTRAAEYQKDIDQLEASN